MEGGSSGARVAGKTVSRRLARPARRSTCVASCMTAAVSSEVVLDAPLHAAALRLQRQRPAVLLDPQVRPRVAHALQGGGRVSGARQAGGVECPALSPAPRRTCLHERCVAPPALPAPPLPTACPAPPLHTGARRTRCVSGARTPAVSRTSWSSVNRKTAWLRCACSSPPHCAWAWACVCVCGCVCGSAQVRGSRVIAPAAGSGAAAPPRRRTPAAPAASPPQHAAWPRSLACRGAPTACPPHAPSQPLRSARTCSVRRL